MIAQVPRSIKLDDKPEVPEGLPSLDGSEEELESGAEEAAETTSIDLLNLLGTGAAKMTGDEETEVIALVRGTGGSNEVIMKVKGDDIRHEDISRLDGPHVPASKRPTDLWLNEKILLFMRHVLFKNNAELCVYDALQKQLILLTHFSS